MKTKILGKDEITDAVPMVYYLATIIPYLAIGVRRMHDVGKSGWFILIPLYNFILAVTQSEPGVNKWGAPQDN